MRRTLIGLAATAALTLPNATQAQTVPQACGDHNAIVERLASKWGETFMGGGLHTASSLFEVWMSKDRGTWTILRTEANGRACVMAAGTNWLESVPSQKVAGIEG